MKNKFYKLKKKFRRRPYTSRGRVSSVCVCVVGDVLLRCVSFCFFTCVFAFCLSSFVRACVLHSCFVLRVCLFFACVCAQKFCRLTTRPCVCRWQCSFEVRFICFSRVCVFAFCLSPFVRACCIHVLFLCVCFRVHVSFFFVCVRVCNSFGVCACVCNFIWRVQLLSVCVQFTFSFRFLCV